MAENKNVELNDEVLDQVAGGAGDNPDSYTFMGQTWTVGQKVRIGLYTGGCRYCGAGNPCPLCTIVRIDPGSMASAKLMTECCGEPEFVNLDCLMKA